MRLRRLTLVTMSLAFAAGGLAGAGAAVAGAAPPAASNAYAMVVPAPVSARPAAGLSFQVRPSTVIATDAVRVAEYLAAVLRRSTGYPLPVRPAAGGAPRGIALLLSGAPASVGDEGYQLDVTGTAVVIRARRPAGLFAGVQTLRQLLPSTVARPTVQAGPWVVPGGHVLGRPRVPYRGPMIHLSRHFLTVAP